MDGVFEESSWSQIIQIIDGADRILHRGPHLFLAFALVSLYYALVGSWLDLLLSAAAIGLGHHRALLTFTSYFGRSLSTVTISIAGAIAIGLVSIRRFLNPNPVLKGPAQPYLIPCKTTHTRLFPKKHAFGYSYLVVGIPVGSTGDFHGILTIDYQSCGSWDLLSKLFRGGWYTVNNADYLQRGVSAHGLRGKLDEYLKSQGVEPSVFPHAYLVTAARFLGYHFNPVSFWYLYSEDKILSAMVLEVNNTFDERRPYLLCGFSPGSQHHTGPGREDTTPSRVKGSWAKDFHVSPFNSRKGAYSLTASDPLGPGMTGFRGIDITINLSSSKGHSKLVTRLVSQGEAIHPASMGPVAEMRFLLRWFWVGFATLPRIVKEAATLFFRRELHVWYRPEPRKESLGRHASKTERQLEVAFRSYLKFLVEQCQKSMSVRYVSSGILSNLEETFTSPSRDGSVEEDGGTLELKVLTPLFYTRFVHYAHDFEAVFTEFMDSATIWVSKPHLLPDLFLKKASPTLQSASMMDYLSLTLIRILRRRPDRIPSVSTSADTKTDEPSIVDIRDFGISSMDAYILEHAQPTLKATYRSTLLRMFVADHLAMGNVALLEFCILLWRIGIASACATVLRQVATYLR
ncbi:uncharacterized protein MAM_03122 [Metarhizium album ARSEF 1941]|uniref:DNA-binding WRKY domain-containing protein n=1 Tax=Metarhizium album (strain ARSEF 1941) TaxID=1081103 RepID=A0A0B2X0P4_METAS|nr:uncharacterized protein MAM_03122 [Metarhizium album ARSEF 1941]KHN99424.1 hypothetical protein MAM_03122 [Metarhizium album ARSEF 1941]